MRKPDFAGLPEEVRREYGRFAAVRLGLSALILAGAGFLASRLDLSGLRSPVMAAAMLLAAAAVLDCILFGVHRFLKPSWEGTVLSVGAFERIRSTGTRGQPGRRMMVEIAVDRGEPKPYVISLFRADKIEHNGVGVNVFQTHAPYKEGDTLLYLRGWRYPTRTVVPDAEELFQPETVCPYCGEFNPLERKRCFRCGRRNAAGGKSR